MKDQTYYNLIAGGLALGVVTLLVVWTGLAVGTGSGSANGATSGSGAASAPAHMYLTVQINPINGEPQYSPANFTVPAGTVIFTIYDYDDVEQWDSCTCNVTGTVGGDELVNGTPMSSVPVTNAAHTFTIPSLGINTVSPGMATLTFTLNLSPGSYTWYCMAPCGSEGYTGAPMGMPGYMEGTMTVA